MNTKIDGIIQNFVAELTAAISAASHEALTTALGGGAASVGNGRAPKVFRRMKAQVAAMQGPPGMLPPGRKRRNQGDVKAQLDAVIAYLKKAKEPQGVEAIGPAIGLNTKELAAPIKIGLKGRLIRRSGVRRGTKYSVRA